MLYFKIIEKSNWKLFQSKFGNNLEKCEEEEVEHAIEVESIEVLKLDNLLYDDETELYVYLVQRHVEDVEWKRLLTLSPNYLCEKDALSGQTLASWKMSSLKSLDVLQRQDAVRFQLFFLPASQSYRQRVYTMEENDFTVIESYFISFNIIFQIKFSNFFFFFK